MPQKNPKTPQEGTTSTPNYWRVSYQTGEIWLQEPNKWLTDSNPNSHSTRKNTSILNDASLPEISALLYSEKNA
jgi:hypothetical protein